MCGISGIVNLKEPNISREVLKSMNDTLSLRGPDAEGFFFSDNVGLGHRRLSIIDLSSGANQPMTSANGRYTIVFNGEIYNFLELKKGLEKDGVLFRTHSDTEVLLELFARHGLSCLADLNGMFVFAIWDAKEKKLYAARDRVGKKPFYYAFIEGNFIFASELKALVKFPGLKKNLDPVALQHYLTYEYVPAPFAMIEGVIKLKQAHALILENGKITTERYWNQPFGEQVDDDEKTASKKILELLDKATQYRLIADVPVGVFLSGGLDSSAVVAMIARHRAGKDIQTFSIGFQEASYDESLYSETVAKKFGTNHHHEILTAATMLDILPDVAGYLDEPFADGSILPTYLLSRFTRKHVTVALGGDGSDELFAGYPTFVASRLANAYQKLPTPLHKTIAGLSKLLPASDKNMSFDFKIRQFLKGVHYPGVLKNQIWLAGVSPEDQRALFSQQLKAQLADSNPLKLVQDEMAHCPSTHPGDELLYFYQKFYMCDDILFKVDRASMANSLEVRAPFLDKDVVDYACRLPYEYKLKGVTTKYLIKKTFNRILPAMITQRSKKGFGIPITGWLKNELKPLLLATLSEERIRKDGFFEWTSVKKLIDEHFAGKHNHRKPLFSLLMLHFWMERYL